MACYKTHCVWNALLILPLSLLVLIPYTSEVQWVAYTCSFIYATLFMTPDADIAHKINPFSLRGILSYPFRYYARFFRHRGLSHRFFWGTLSRLIWLVFFFTPPFILFYFFFPSAPEHIFPFLWAHRELLLLIIIAPFIADLGHLILDALF